MILPSLRLYLPFVALWLLLLLAACSANDAIIAWETASEVGTAGFNLYRGPGPDGPWTQVNATLIPPAADPVSGGRYRFTDAGAARGQVYYYQLEEVELTGGVNRYPPTRLQVDDRQGLWVAGMVVGALALALGWWGGGRWRRRRLAPP